MSHVIKAQPDSLMDASYNAQQIAFAPVIFQVTKSLRDLGILDAIADSGKRGVTVDVIEEKTGVSEYGIKVLLELGLKIGLVSEKDGLYRLLPTGRFILSDRMSRINMDFIHDVCYQGLFHLEEAIKTGEPSGLRVFGEWDTIYEALSELPDQVQKSWFDFDHFYSDTAFPEALPIVFRNKPKTLLDIGGNTGKWSIACCTYDEDVEITILDLPGQLKKAKANIDAQGLGSRINLRPINLLDHAQPYPEGFDALWMSQFLVCFSEQDVVELLKRAAAAMNPGSTLFILDTFCDRQRNEIGEFCLEASSLYFTCMANGNSRMYRFETIAKCIEEAGLEILEEDDYLGGDHTLLTCRLM